MAKRKKSSVSADTNTKPSSAMPAGKWRSRIVGNGEADPATLIPNKLNWRTHPRMQAMALQGALDQIGWIQQIVVNKRSGQLLDGHLRVALAVQHPEPLVPVLYVDLGDDEERLALLTLDPIAAMAEADLDGLNILLRQVSTSDEGIQHVLETLALSHDLVPPEPGQPTSRGAGSGGEAVDTTPEDAPNSNIHMVQLFLTEATYPPFKRQCDQLALEYGMETMTDTVVAVIRRAVDAIEAGTPF